MVDKNVITSRAEQIDRHLSKIDKYKKITFDEFIKDSVIQDVVEYNIFQITNHIIDISQHIVVDEDYGIPQTSYDAVQILFDKDVFSMKDKNMLKKMIGFRNVIGHDYLNIDKQVVYFILTKGIKDIKEILSKLTEKFL